MNFTLYLPLLLPLPAAGFLGLCLAYADCVTVMCRCWSSRSRSSWGDRRKQQQLWRTRLKHLRAIEHTLHMLLMA